MVSMRKTARIPKVFSNPKYRGRHVVVTGGRIYSSKTGRGVVKILDRLNRDHPKIIPEISYIPKPHTLILWMVVDTGADHSILPKYFSHSLGISLNKDCYKEWTAGVGGDQKIFMLKKPLRVKLGEVEHYIPIAISEKDNIPPIMSRLGFIDSFNVEFLIKRQVIFKT